MTHQSHSVVSGWHTAKYPAGTIECRSYRQIDDRPLTIDVPSVWEKWFRTWRGRGSSGGAPLDAG